MATSKSTDFLRFSAYSIKDAIIRKLAEDSNFTDQVYEGSNLNIIIDIVSYMYQCLLFNLNNAASESMFADTQIYENISRLVKFIGYNPQGCFPSQATVIVKSDDDKTVLKFSKVDTGLTDSNGKKIYFSAVDSSNMKNDIHVQGKQHTINLVNGEFKLYPTIFTASGSENEKFVLSGIKSDDAASTSNSHVAQSYFYVVVRTDDKYAVWQYDREQILMHKYKDDDNPTFANIYNGMETVYNIRLNEDKTYELQFGDGKIGAKLNEGDLVYVFYLATNGNDGNVDLGYIQEDGLKFKHSPSEFGIDDELYNAIFNQLPDSKENIANGNDYTVRFQPNSLVEYTHEETVSEIRDSAPNWFKTGNRLITAKDYEYFIRSNAAFKDVVSVKCMNNWEYIATFFKWLYYYGINYNKTLRSDKFGKKRPTTTVSDAYYYLQQQRIESNDYKFVDAADACNIYLWMELQDNEGMSLKNSTIDDQMQYLKTLTTEIYALSPVHVDFDICAYGEDIQLESLYSETGDFIDNGSYIEITLDDNSIYVTSAIQQQVVTKLHNYFSKKNCQIGQFVDYNKILESVYSINGVINVRTVFEPSQSQIDAGYKTVVKNGLSFASFSTDILDLGEDLDISNSSKKLEPFQFPRLHKAQNSKYWLNKVKVIKKSLANVSPIKY